MNDTEIREAKGRVIEDFQRAKEQLILLQYDACKVAKALRKYAEFLEHGAEGDPPEDIPELSMLTKTLQASRSEKHHLSEVLRELRIPLA